MKTKEIKRYNLANDRIVVRHIDAKPIELLILIIIISIFVSFKTSWLIGGAFVFSGCILFMVLPSRILIEFMEDYLVLYNKGNSSDCVIVYYDEVVSWYYSRKFNYDELVIELIDGSVVRIEAFSKIIFENDMNIFLSDKRDKTK